MATRGIGLERARRKQWLTRLVAGSISVTALAVGLAYWLSFRKQSGPVRILPSPPADVHQEVSGYTFTRSEQGRAVFTIHAARTVAYQQNKSTTLEDVTAEVFGRKGENSDILRTHRCEYNPQSGDFLSSGPVDIELSAHASNLPGTGLRGKHRIFLQTSKVAYHQRDALAETDEPVKFSMGPATGTALGMIYETRDGWMELKHDVIADLRQGTGNAPQMPIHLTASALRYDKEGGMVSLAGPVRVTDGARRAVSDKATVELDDFNRVSKIYLEGHSQAYDVNPLRNVKLSAERVRADFDPVSGELRRLIAEKDVSGESQDKKSTSRMTADQVDLDLRSKHPQPVQGIATGNVRIGVESQPVLETAEKSPASVNPEKKVLTAGKVRFDFHSVTHGLKTAETVGPGTLVVSPSDPKTGERVLSAGQILMKFNPRSQIESLRGLAPTEVLFRPPATAPPETETQQSRADQLNALFNPGTGTLREVRQTGNYQYRAGDRQASAEEARYDAQAQTTLLVGHPQVWDTNTRIKCQKISIDMRTNTSVGDGHVQATHLPGPPPSNTSGPPSPTNVLADKMIAQRQSQTVHYEGHVRAWHGTDVLESSALDVYRAERRISSGTQVLTSYLQPASVVSGQAPSTQTAREMSPVTVRADHLEYFDQGRRARYDGNVRLVTESTVLLSDHLDVYFTQGKTVEGSEVERAVGDGHVTVTKPGREGKGDHAEYFAADGKVVLTGGPPILVDDQKGSTTGQRLTFFIHDDRLWVDGGDKSPSLSKHRVAP